ncbi:hypothetical protein B296_00037778 [Ensete ventricosum]|uniref:Uncharacterized protein n=1 Tax=Ensete ventricosum TaxID=4639 RepID=A0A426XY24_ENSVE|nr:hypothetical protein B296_00037778 [Ensete ventricosum]
MLSAWELAAKMKTRRATRREERLWEAMVDCRWRLAKASFMLYRDKGWDGTCTRDKEMAEGGCALGSQQEDFD